MAPAAVPPPPPGGASRQAAGPARPPLPKHYLFSGKNIIATAVGNAVSFGVSSNENVQIAVPFIIKEGQKATTYSAPDAGPHKPGVFEEVPPGSDVTYIKALTPDAAPYAIEALTNAGWRGAALRSLKTRPDGLGDVEVKLTITIKEKDKDGEWLKDDEGNFRPMMSVDWVNKTAGFQFKKEADDDVLKKLDAELAPVVRAAVTKAGGPAKPAAAPAKPGTPPAPVKPVTPAAPVKPVAPAPVKPVTPAAPAAPAKPASAAAAKPAAAPAAPVKPPAAPVKPVTPAPKPVPPKPVVQEEPPANPSDIPAEEEPVAEEPVAESESAEDVPVDGEPPVGGDDDIPF